MLDSDSNNSTPSPNPGRASPDSDPPSPRLRYEPPAGYYPRANAGNYVMTSPSYSPRQASTPTSPSYNPTSPSYNSWSPNSPQAGTAPVDQAVVASAVVAPADQAVVAPAEVAQASLAGSISDALAKNRLIKPVARDSAKAALELANENDKEIAMHEGRIQNCKRELEIIDEQIENLKKRRKNVARDLKQTEEVLMKSLDEYETFVIKGHNETANGLNSIIHPDMD